MSIVTVEDNPYQSPATGETDAYDATRPLIFRGSMSVAEFREVHRAKKRFTNLVGKLVGFVFLAFGIAASAYAVYAILFEGFDDFVPSALLGIGLVCAVPLIVYAERASNNKKLGALNIQQTGVFSPVRGEVSNSGIFIATVDRAQDSGWDTFCGYRDRRDAIVVFTRFPDEYIAIAASCFANAEEWESARRMIQSKVSPIAPWAFTVDRTTELAASPMGRAMHHLLLSQWQAAISTFDEILANEPENVLALRRRAKAIIASESDTVKVLTAVQAAIEHGANDTAMLHTRADLLIACEQYESALVDYEELVRRDPEDTDNLRNRGLTLLKLGGFERAIEDCSGAIRYSPGDAVAYNNRGVARLQLGQIDEAIVDFKKAISLEPAFPNPQQHLDRARTMLAAEV